MEWWLVEGEVDAVVVSCQDFGMCPVAEPFHLIWVSLLNCEPHHLTRSLSPSPSPSNPHSRTPSSSALALVTTQPEGIRILGQPSTCPVTLASTWFYTPPVYSSTGYCPYRHREIMVLLEGMYIYPDGNRFKTPVWVEDGTVVHVVQRDFSREFVFPRLLPLSLLSSMSSLPSIFEVGETRTDNK